MNTTKIIIRLDYLQGPIWISDAETGQPMTGIDLIDNDQEVILYNRSISDLYSSFFEFNSKNNACLFNTEREKENKEKLLNLLNNLINRLNEINDGSYEIDDEETSRISLL